MGRSKVVTGAVALLALCLTTSGCPGAGQAPAGNRTEIETLLEDQAAAWSRGDLEAFVAGYAEDAAFVTPSGVTRGRDEVLARYRRRYPDRAAMGRLTLEVLDLRLLANRERPAAASVVARWALEGMGEDGAGRAEGHTVIVFERRPEGWRIVHDASM